MGGSKKTEEHYTCRYKEVQYLFARFRSASFAQSLRCFMQSCKGRVNYFVHRTAIAVKEHSNHSKWCCSLASIPL